jgi:hypothetical protein
MRRKEATVKRVGRPRLSPGERLGEIIGINMSASMRQRLEREALDAGYRSLSRYIRERRLAPGVQEDNARQ